MLWFVALLFALPFAADAQSTEPFFVIEGPNLAELQLGTEYELVIRSTDAFRAYAVAHGLFAIQFAVHSANARLTDFTWNLAGDASPGPNEAFDGSTPAVIATLTGTLNVVVNPVATLRFVAGSSATSCGQLTINLRPRAIAPGELPDQLTDSSFYLSTSPYFADVNNGHPLSFVATLPRCAPRIGGTGGVRVYERAVTGYQSFPR